MPKSAKKMLPQSFCGAEAQNIHEVNSLKPIHRDILSIDTHQIMQNNMFEYHLHGNLGTAMASHGLPIRNAEKG